MELDQEELVPKNRVREYPHLKETVVALIKVIEEGLDVIGGNKSMDSNYLTKLIEKANKAIEVAKPLTTKQRKKMKSGTFCGPGRSFPVPDCKHVGVAKTYLARAKFSAATKKKIAACINRKAKSLGCTPGKKAKASDSWEDYFPKYVELSTDEKQIYSSDVFTYTKELVEQSLKNPGMDLFEEAE